MDDHFDIGRVFEIGKFDITRLTCICILKGEKLYFSPKNYFKKMSPTALPYLKFSDPLPETPIFFYLAI